MKGAESMGRKRARAPAARPPPAAVAVRAEPQDVLAPPHDDRIEYTDQHGAHWVSDECTSHLNICYCFALVCMPCAGTMLALTHDHVPPLDGNWVAYEELRAYEDDKEDSANATRSRKHKKQGRRGGGKLKPPKKYLVPPMQYVNEVPSHGILLSACNRVSRLLCVAG